MSKIEWERIAGTPRRISSYRDRDFAIGLLEKAPLDGSVLTKMMDMAIAQYPSEKRFKQIGSFFEPVSDHLWDNIVSGRPIASRSR